MSKITILTLCALVIGCAPSHSEPVARASQPDVTVVLYDYPGWPPDAGAPPGGAGSYVLHETTTLWTAPSNATLTHLTLTNGPDAVVVYDCGSTGWNQIEVNQVLADGSGALGYWFPTFALDCGCATGALAAGASTDQADPYWNGCGGPPQAISAGDSFTVDITGWASPPPLGPFSIQLAYSVP